MADNSKNHGLQGAPGRVGQEACIIGHNLKVIRKDRGYSQRQLAEILGTSFQQVQKYEKGQNRISAEKLFRLRSFLKVPYARFFEGLEYDQDNQDNQDNKFKSRTQVSISQSKFIWLDKETYKVGLIFMGEEGGQVDPEIIYHLNRLVENI